MQILIRLAAMAACASVFSGALSVTAAKQDNGPVTIPTKVVGNQWMIRATVDGHEGWFLLAPESKNSILLPLTGQSGPDGRIHRAPVSIGPVNGDNISFKILSSPNLKPLGVNGVLGADALAGFNLAIDIEEAQVSTWQEQPSLYSERGWVLLLPMIGSSTQHATTLSVDDVDKLPSGIPCSVGLAHGLAVLQASDPITRISAQALASTDTLTVSEGSSGSVVVDNLTVGEVGPYWTVTSGSTAALPGASLKQIAAIPISSLPVRRIVLDGHTGTIVTEELGPTGIDSVQLSRLLGIPLDIEQGSLYLRHEGALYGSDLASYDRATVVDIAGILPVDIVSALNGPSAAKLQILKRLAAARIAGYKLDIQLGGKDFATMVKPAK
jgi:hypothetical protein